MSKRYHRIHNAFATIEQEGEQADIGFELFDDPLINGQKPATASETSHIASSLLPAVWSYIRLCVSPSHRVTKQLEACAADVDSIIDSSGPRPADCIYSA